MIWNQVIPLIFPELILIATACLLFLLGVSQQRTVRKVVPVLALLGVVAAFYVQMDRVSFGPSVDGGPAVQADSIGAIRLGAMAQFIKLLAIGVGSMFVLLSWPTDADGGGNSAVQYGADAGGEFFGLLLLCLAGILLVAGANDLILLFLGIELASIPTYIMVSISRPQPVAQEAGVKYFFLGAMAAAIMLFGFSYLYGSTGLINLHDLTGYFVNQRGLSMGPQPLTQWQLLAVVMLIAGLAFKIAAVPLHFYAGDVYEGAATPVTALLSFVPKITGFVALLKILFVVSSGLWVLPLQITNLLWVIAVLTMSVGNVLGLLQQNIKRVLAYSSIAHTGYMLVGVTVLLESHGNIEALEGILFYLTAYGIMNVAAFGVLMLLPARNGRGSAETYDDIAGAGKRNVGLGLAMATACFSLIGLPLTIGFFGKFFLIRPALAAGDIWIVVIMMINAAIGAAYYLRIVAAMFLRPDPQAEQPAPAAPARRATPILVAVVLSTGATLLFGTVIPATQLLRLQTEQATHIDDRPQRTAEAVAVQP